MENVNDPAVGSNPNQTTVLPWIDGSVVTPQGFTAKCWVLNGRSLAADRTHVIGVLYLFVDVDSVVAGRPPVDLIVFRVPHNVGVKVTELASREVLRAIINTECEYQCDGFTVSFSNGDLCETVVKPLPPKEPSRIILPG